SANPIAGSRPRAKAGSRRPSPIPRSAAGVRGSKTARRLRAPPAWRARGAERSGVPLRDSRAVTGCLADLLLRVLQLLELVDRQLALARLHPIGKYLADRARVLPVDLPAGHGACDLLLPDARVGMGAKRRQRRLPLEFVELVRPRLAANGCNLPALLDTLRVV